MPLPSTNATTTYHRVQVDGIRIFYREAGPESAPTIVLLHGFPSSLREFGTLIPLLATKYRLIAPDYPGFGLSDAPSPTAYTYTFDHLAQAINDLLEKLKVTHYTLYLHDYGAPVGFRIILAHPDRLHALIIQNGNIYKAGLGTKWTKIAEYWSDPTAHPKVLDAFLSFKATKERHVAETYNPDRYDPDTWISEYADLSRPGRREIQGDLLYDYRTNVVSYPEWQAWLRAHQPPHPCGLGRARPFLYRAARGSLQASSSECGNPPAGRWALRTGRKDRRDCGLDPPVHGRASGMRIFPFTKLPAASQVGFGAAQCKRGHHTWRSLTRIFLIRPTNQWICDVL